MHRKSLIPNIRTLSLALLSISVGVCGWIDAAHAEFGINFPEPVSSGARDIYAIHMQTTAIATGILVVMFALILYPVFFHRKSRGYQPDQNFHKTWFAKWSWLLIPLIVLGVDLSIASNAQRVLEDLWLVPKDKDMMDVKVTGHQWWWEYEYVDDGIAVQSRYVPKEEAGDLYLREVDNRLVLPTNTKIRFLHTSVDVLHAFWVPELGGKRDAIPGYITETWVEIDKEGVYRGQCAELCGTWHTRMPIVVESVSPEKFKDWVAEQKVAAAAAAEEAAADKVWAMEDLMERGEGLYRTNCAACHQINGQGLPPAFPALAGSEVALGPLAGHLDIVINGKAGTAMAPWGGLNDLEIAAIVTYERNSWDNGTGDVVQPASVKQARAGSQAATR